MAIYFAHMMYLSCAARGRREGLADGGIAWVLAGGVVALISRLGGICHVEDPGSESARIWVAWAGPERCEVCPAQGAAEPVRNPARPSWARNSVARRRGEARHIRCDSGRHRYPGRRCVAGSGLAVRGAESPAGGG